MENDGKLLHTVETVPVSDLKDHPRNYVNHPEDEIAHIAESLLEHGQYKNIVTARDLTILAGHGVKRAMIKIGGEMANIVRLDVDPYDPRALKILAGDNEIAHLSEKDDRALTELLKQIKDTDSIGLLGTGYDEQMLAALVFITRPRSEILDFNSAAHWIGMPEFEEGNETIRLIVNFLTEQDKQDFIAKHGFKFLSNSISVWWPPIKEQKDDPSAVRFESNGKDEQDIS